MTPSLYAVVILSLLLTAATLRLLWLEAECWRLRDALAHYLGIISDLIGGDE